VFLVIEPVSVQNFPEERVLMLKVLRMRLELLEEVVMDLLIREQLAQERVLLIESSGIVVLKLLFMLVERDVRRIDLRLSIVDLDMARFSRHATPNGDRRDHMDNFPQT